MIIEHPHLDGSAGQAVIPVRYCVDKRLLPSEGWILEPFAKEKIVQYRALANMFFDPANRFVDQAYQRRFETNPLDHVERATVLPFRAFVFDEIDTGARVPARRVFGE